MSVASPQMSVAVDDIASLIAREQNRYERKSKKYSSRERPRSDLGRHDLQVGPGIPRARPSKPRSKPPRRLKQSTEQQHVAAKPRAQKSKPQSKPQLKRPPIPHGLKERKLAGRSDRDAPVSQRSGPPAAPKVPHGVGDKKPPHQQKRRRRKQKVPRTLEEHLQSMGLGHSLALFHWVGASDAQDLALLDCDELAALGLAPDEVDRVEDSLDEAGLPMRDSLKDNAMHKQSISLSSKDMSQLLAAVTREQSGKDAGKPPSADAMEKAVPGISAKPWVCHRCTFLNEVAYTVFCGMCEARKQVSDGIMTPSSPPETSFDEALSSPERSSPEHASPERAAPPQERQLPHPESDSAASSAATTPAITPRANLSAAARAAAELSQRRRESSELSPYLNAHLTHTQRRTTTTANSKADLQFNAKVLLLQMDDSGSDSASDFEGNAVSRPKLRELRPRKRANSKKENWDQAVASPADSSAASNENRPRGKALYRKSNKRDMSQIVVEALGADIYDSSSSATSTPRANAAAARGEPVPDYQRADSGVAIGEIDEEDRIVDPRAAPHSAKLCDGFLKKKSSKVPWQYLRRWFTLSIPRGEVGMPILYYSTGLLTPDNEGSSPRSSADCARGERLITTDCRIQLNGADVAQIGATLDAGKLHLLESRVLGYLEFAVVRDGTRKGVDELLRAKANSPVELRRWVHCLCHAIHHCANISKISSAHSVPRLPDAAF